MNYRQQVLQETGSSLWTTPQLCSVFCYTRDTADADELYFCQYADNMKQAPDYEYEVFTESLSFQDALKTAIKEGNRIYIGEYLQEDQELADSCSDFWQELHEEITETA